MARRRTDPEIFLIKRLRLWAYVQKELELRGWSQSQVQTVYEVLFNGMDELGFELAYRKSKEAGSNETGGEG